MCEDFMRLDTPTKPSRVLLSSVDTPIWYSLNREAGLAGRILYLDLDTVVTGSLDDLAGYSGPFAALSVEEMTNERRRAGLNSSVMCWDADREAAAVQPVHDMLKDAYEVVS